MPTPPCPQPAASPTPCRADRTNPVKPSSKLDCKDSPSCKDKLFGHTLRVRQGIAALLDSQQCKAWWLSPTCMAPLCQVLGVMHKLCPETRPVDLYSIRDSFNPATCKVLKYLVTRGNHKSTMTQYIWHREHGVPTLPHVHGTAGRHTLCLATPPRQLLPTPQCVQWRGCCASSRHTPSTSWARAGLLPCSSSTPASWGGWTRSCTPPL